MAKGMLLGCSMIVLVLGGIGFAHGEAGDPGVEPAVPVEEGLALLFGVGGVTYTSGGCSATATCANKPSVTCSTSSSSGTCSFQDTVCSPFTQGYVECNGMRTWCPVDSCDRDCSQFDYPGCSYFWNRSLQCCEVEQLGEEECLLAC